MILEGIVTTLNEDGGVNISPMGPLVDRAVTELVLRPFKTSRTFANLKRARKGVLHVTDNVEILAQAAVGRLDPAPELVKVPDFDGWALADSCRWYAFEATQVFEPADRATVECQIVSKGGQREFFGFNRAMHAVIEASILATRVDRLSRVDIRVELARLEPLVKKTGGDREARAFQFLIDYIEDWFAANEE